MRCWGVDTSVYDGQKEWTVIVQGTTSQSGMPWIYFRPLNEPVHFIVFGEGTLGPLLPVTKELRNERRMLETVGSIPKAEMIVFCGHSQGAGWAVVLNLVSAVFGRPAATRHVIGTGAPLASRYFFADYKTKASPSETSMLLLVGLEASESRLITDSAMIVNSVDFGSTALPQFAYACKGKTADDMTCLDPQPERFSMDDSIEALTSPTEPILDSLHY